MLSQFLNPLMLIGLAGLALPILVHLLNRKRYDVVDWGAMQFLELGRTTRRRLRLEQLLLLVLRMGLIALVVLAMSRPWARGGLYSNVGTGQRRDVVFVVDGSYSMGWEGEAVTPHARAVGWIHRFLEELRPGDTVSLVDAREQPRMLLDSPTPNFAELRAKSNVLPAPAGTANLASAVSQAARILGRTGNPSREIIVLTDGQAHGWSAEDAALWTRFDVLRNEASVRPDVWVVNLRQSQGVESVNFHVGRLELSREVTVAGFPVRVRTRVGYTGTENAVARAVFFEVDGQRLSDQTVRVQLSPEQEVDVEFEHRFNSPGSHVVSVVLDDDNLPADNRSDAVVTVAEAIPLVLIDGSPHLDPTQTESYFASAALSAKGNDTPWVRLNVLSAAQLDAASIARADVVVLANVGNLTAAQGAALTKYVQDGGGLMIAPGDHVEASSYNTLLFGESRGPLPVPLDVIATADNPVAGNHIRGTSLEVPWLRAFRDENDGGLTEARVSRWWKVSATSVPAAENANVPAKAGNAPAAPKAAEKPSQSAVSLATDALVAAKFDNDDAFLIARPFGRGRVILMTVPLDADWSTLPAKADYVPLLHEIVFHLVSGRSERNVDVGATLVLPLSSGIDVTQFAFIGPGDATFEPTRTGGERLPSVQLADARVPGLYRFGRKPDARRPAEATRPEFFVVNCDRGESDLRPLSDDELNSLASNGRMTFVTDSGDLKREMIVDDTRSEYWYLLMFGFLSILIAEAAMTRHLVKGGHAVVEDEPAPMALPE